jgi:retinol dehydrogenase 12
MVGVISLITGMAGPSGFGSASTAEQVTEGIDASNLTAIITGSVTDLNLPIDHFHHLNLYIHAIN